MSHFAQADSCQTSRDHLIPLGVRIGPDNHYSSADFHIPLGTESPINDREWRIEEIIESK